MMTIQSNRPLVTGLILAGGQGTRMGGADKGLALWNGKPLVANALQRLKPQVETLIISANRNQAIYAQWGYPVIQDQIADYSGPLAGLHAGLLACTTPLLVCVPCDTPEFPMDLVARLFETLQQNPEAAVSWAASDSGDHPVFLLCKKELASSLENYLMQGKRRVRDFLLEAGGIATHYDEEAAFTNLNTLDDLARKHQVKAQ